MHERYRMCGNVKIKDADRLHGDKAFVHNNKIINLDYKNVEFPIPCNNFYTIKKN